MQAITSLRRSGIKLTQRAMHVAILSALLHGCVHQPTPNSSSEGEIVVPGRHDGAIRVLDSGEWQAWDAVVALWLEPQRFWESYAARGNGHYWGRLTELPSYQNSKEFDTFILETPHGSCLMEFFHQRWRRANDVRRWDERYNQYSGCAQVFGPPSQPG